MMGDVFVCTGISAFQQGQLQIETGHDLLIHLVRFVVTEWFNISISLSDYEP